MDKDFSEFLDAPVELDAAELLAVAGGLNPQPLPPHGGGPEE
jgi:hypothetical protein